MSISQNELDQCFNAGINAAAAGREKVAIFDDTTMDIIARIAGKHASDDTSTDISNCISEELTGAEASVRAIEKFHAGYVSFSNPA